MNPKKDDAPQDLPADITYEFAQKEIAQAKGFATSTAGLTKGNTCSRILRPFLLFCLGVFLKYNHSNHSYESHQFL